jgi:hypothetical protein
MQAQEIVQAARSAYPGFPPLARVQQMTHSAPRGGEMAMRAAASRAAVLNELQQTLVPADRALLCFILEQEIRSRVHDSGGEFFENLYWAGFLLSLVAQVEDVRLLWSVKTLDFDTWNGFDVQFLVGAGVSRTLSYLHSLQEEWAAAAWTYLEQCQQAGDFADLEQYRQRRRTYFR